MREDTKLLLPKLKTELQKSDEKTFISLFKDHYVCLCAYSRRYVHRKDIAEHIVCETFFKIWENRKTLEIHSSLKSYLFKTVANNSLHHLRKFSREEMIENHFSCTEDENIGFKELSGNATDQSILMCELNSRIQEAINQLPPQQRTIFRINRYEGLKNKEIAEKMGLAVKRL